MSEWILANLKREEKRVKKNDRNNSPYPIAELVIADL
jgi:hypothetical protein